MLGLGNVKVNLGWASNWIPGHDGAYVSPGLRITSTDTVRIT